MADLHKADTHWRDSARAARFFFIDARSVFPLVLFLFHISWWTFYVAIVASVFFAALEHYGFAVPVFLRWLRSLLAGPLKKAVPFWKD